MALWKQCIIWQRFYSNYYLGGDIDENDGKVFKYYKIAAEKGYIDAMFKLGVAYELGTGVEKNIRYAKEWYQKAADNGSSDAKFALKRLGD